MAADLKALRQAHGFKILLTAFLTGRFAFQMQTVALGWQVFSLRHSPFDLGLVGLAAFLPTLCLAIVAGVVADRYDRKIIVALAAAGETIGFCALMALVHAHTDSIAPYLMVELLMGTVRAFGEPAEGTLLISIVPQERYLSASARYSSLRQLITIGGPTAGGVLYALGPAIAFGAAALVQSIATMAFIALYVERVAIAQSAPTLRVALEGIRFIFARQRLLGAMSLDLVAVLFGGATALLPAFADILHWGPVGLGALRSAPALGAASVGLWIAKRPPSRHVGRTLLIAVAGFGASTIVFGLSRWGVLSLIALVFVGGTDMVSMVIRDGLTTLNTPNEMRGRVNAAEGVFIGASNQLGAFESGTLAAAIGIVPAVVAGGIVTIGVILLWTRFFPGLVKADRYVDA